VRFDLLAKVAIGDFGVGIEVEAAKNCPCLVVSRIVPVADHEVRQVVLINSASALIIDCGEARVC